MTGIGVPHTEYTEIQIGGCQLEYNPENPDSYVLIS